MFINTALGTVFDPSLYPGKFVICVDTDDGDLDLGLFSGRHGGFTLKEEMGQRQDTVEDDTWSGSGFEVFEIVRKPFAHKHQVIQFHYAVIGWYRSSYVGYPVGRELILTNTHGEPWNVCFAGVTVILPDYGQV